MKGICEDMNFSCLRDGARGLNGNKLSGSLIDSRGATFPDAAWVEILKKACTEDPAIHKLSVLLQSFVFPIDNSETG